MQANDEQIAAAEERWKKKIAAMSPERRAIFEDMAKQPKLCSVETPWGVVTYFEGEEPFTPEVLAEFEVQGCKKKLAQKNKEETG